MTDLRAAIGRAKEAVANSGWRNALFATVARITAGRIDLTEGAAIRSSKRRISRRIARNAEYRVKYGPFAGLRLSTTPLWGTGESGAQCLGLYEKEIQELLAEIQRERRKSVLIDVGGADGFFALGSLFSGMFSRCITFEANAALRAGLDELAYANQIRDNIEIRGLATQDALVDAVRECGGDCVVLCDIEGGEYALFESALLVAIKNIDVIIELHEFDEEMKSRCSIFVERICSERPARLIRTGGRDFSTIPEAEFLSDLERALLAAEGRMRLGKWLYLPAVG